MIEIISLLIEEIAHTYAMILIIVISVAFIASIIIIFLSKTSLFKKWTEKNKGKSSLTLSTLGVLGLKRIKKKGEFTRLEGVYHGKEIKISRFQQRSGMYEIGIAISVSFCDRSLLPRSKFAKFIFVPRSYFRLYKKRAGIKWSNFENTFKISSKIDQVLNKKTRSDIETLFHKGYFSYVVNTNLTVWASHCDKRSIGKKEGKVVFKLPIDIVKDVDSLKMAMDIVTEIAKKMDKMASHKFISNPSIIDEIKENICESLRDTFNE